MLNSFVAKAAPSFISHKPSYLNKILSNCLPTRNFASSVAFNVKSKFESAFEKKRATMAAAPKKE